VLIVGFSAGIAVFDMGFVARTFHGWLGHDETTAYLLKMSEVATFAGSTGFAVQRLLQCLRRKEIIVAVIAAAATAAIWINELRLCRDAQELARPRTSDGPGHRHIGYVFQKSNLSPFRQLVWFAAVSR